MTRNGTGVRENRVVLGAAVVVLLAGCNVQQGPPTAKLTGAVTIDGQAVPSDAEATITFRADGRGAGPIGDGRYRRWAVRITGHAGG